MCMDNDWDSQVLREVKRKARKVHRCEECRKPILPGEYYVVTSTLMDHSVSEYKNCLKCEKIATAHFAAERALGHYGGMYELGLLTQQIAECIREEPAYLGNFRKAWKGEALPIYVQPSRSYSSNFSSERR